RPADPDRDNVHVVRLPVADELLHLPHVLHGTPEPDDLSDSILDHFFNDDAPLTGTAFAAWTAQPAALLRAVAEKRIGRGRKERPTSRWCLARSGQQSASRAAWQHRPWRLN